MARQPSQPPLSVSFFRVRDSSREAAGFNKGMVLLQVSNKMSFTLNYRIAAEVLRSEKWESDLHAGSTFGFLPAHSQREFAFVHPDKIRLSVSYHRQLKPIEVSILKQFPWLRQHYPFHRCSSTPIYEWTKSETIK